MIGAAATGTVTVTVGARDSDSDELQGLPVNLKGPGRGRGAAPRRSAASPSPSQLRAAIGRLPQCPGLAWSRLAAHCGVMRYVSPSLWARIHICTRQTKIHISGCTRRTCIHVLPLYARRRTGCTHDRRAWPGPAQGAVAGGHDDSEGCQAGARAYWRCRLGAATQEEQRWRTHQHSLLKIFSRFLRTLRFICSQDSIARDGETVSRGE
jgi:hypothetical protein